MDANSESEVTVINNSFYPEKIIFCVDISGEMNQFLEFADLPYPLYKEAETSDNYQTQTLSVPTSTIPSPEGSPKNIHKSNPGTYKIIEPINAATASSTTDPAAMNNRSNYQQNNGFISDTNTTASNNNSNMTYNNNNDIANACENSVNNSNINAHYRDYNSNMGSLPKSRSIKNLKSFTNTAKKLLSKNKDEDSGASDSGTRSNSPMKNLKTSYSNIVQNVLSNNHSRASSNSSTGSLNSLSNSAILNNNDYPALKTPIELTRLEAVKRYIKRFVSLKGSLCKDHQYALVLLGVEAIWYNDFTSDYKSIINAIDGIPAQQEFIQEFDMDSLFNLINERSLIPNALTSSHYLRVIFLYSRPTIPNINLDNVIFQQLHESKLFMFDCVYFHDKKSESNDPQAVYNALLKMENQSHPSLYYDVIRSGQR